MKLLLTAFFLLLSTGYCHAQWSSNPEENNRIGKPGEDYYEQEVYTNKDGVSYCVTVFPNGHDENGNSLLSFNLQVVDKDGKCLLPEGGKEISRERNRSYLVVDFLGQIDRDGNLLYAIHDGRNADPQQIALGYTLYKFGPDGEMLWDNPVDVWNGQTFAGSACYTMTTTDDGGIVLAFTSFPMIESSSEQSKVRIEKISAKGESLWQKTIEKEKVPFSYPFVKDAGDNQVILTFSQGSQQFLMARMIDFDGSEVWDKDAVIYQGGFDQTPVWTYLRVNQAPDGGVAVSWRDDRSSEGTFSNYLSYIQNDGTQGFTDAEGGLKLSYDDNYSRWAPEIYVDKKNRCFYAAYRQFDQGQQSIQGIYMQKVGLDGELIWGADGMPVVDMQNDVSLGYVNIQAADGDNIVVGWQQHEEVVYNTQSLIRKFNSDGNPLWQHPLRFTTTKSEKSNLQLSPLIDNNYWIASWKDGRDLPGQVQKSCLYMQRINVDGTLGDPSTGIKDIVPTDDDAPCLYFNLQGQRTHANGHGLLLKKQGKYVKKSIQ